MKESQGPALGHVRWRGFVMARTQRRGREHEQGDLAMSDQGMVSKTTTNPRNRVSSISSCPSSAGCSQQHPAQGLAQGMDPALTVDASHSQSSNIKAQNPPPSSNDFTSYKVDALGPLSGRDTV